MVEQWELDWNSSMIQYGVDAGTLEYILAKGGNLSDVNYVMLDQQDDGWEPIIKAIAERDNSHPDIIRKQVQQPYGVTGDFRPAVPMNVGNVQTAIRSKRDARNVLGAQRVNQAQQNIEAAQAAGQAPRGRDFAQTGQRLRGLIQGAKNIGSEVLSPAYYGATDAMGRGIDSAMPAMAGAAQRVAGAAKAGAGAVAGAGRKVGGAIAGAGRFLADKYPGVKQRMGKFVQGVGDVARYGREAFDASRDQANSMRHADARRKNLEGGLGRMEDEIANINRRHPEGASMSARQRQGAMEELANRYSKNFYPEGMPPLEEGQTIQDAMRAEVKGLGEDLRKPRRGTIGRALQMGRDKRFLDTAQNQLAAAGLGDEAQPQAEENVPLPEETVAAVEEQMEAVDPTTASDASADRTRQNPLAGMTPAQPEVKPPEAPSPVPTPAETTEENPLAGLTPTTADNNTTTGTFTGQDMAPMSRAELDQYYADNIAGHYGDPDAGPEYASKDRRRQMARIHAKEEDLTPTSFPGKGQGLAASNMLQSLGIEMVQLGHAEDQQEAQEVIEDAQQGDAEAKAKVEATQNKVPARKPSRRLTLSEDKLDSQWDALLKRLEVR